MAAAAGRPLAELTRREIAARLLELKDASGSVAANRARASLSALFTWAIQQGLADVNPVTGTAKNEERPRERVLTMDELREVWAATAEPGIYNAAVRVLMLTGQRKGEVGGMRGPSSTSTRRSGAPGERTKNGRPMGAAGPSGRRDHPGAAESSAIMCSATGAPLPSRLVARQETPGGSGSSRRDARSTGGQGDAAVDVPRFAPVGGDSCRRG